uniref:Transcription factor, MADS-box n=1 Tax=Tanacetum cinerariifolium TaxID=118510 RepID=A0A699HHZ9_TANCI|nr:transcription factor, MADS-box [Tanacetum cinerariifolium]
MGRWKVPMELIIDEKKRKLAFIRRKECSLKKARELATLCDVNVFMIISSDYQKAPIRSYGLLEFCKDGKDNIEGELAKTKKRNLEGKHPKRSGFMDKLKEVAILNLKQKRYAEVLAYVEEAKNLWSELDGVINLEAVIKLRSMEGDKHYEVLGVSTKASNVELTRDYRKTMFVVHPDKCLEFSKAAIEATKRVRDAYRVLSDDDARRNYDHMFKSLSESPKNHHVGSLVVSSKRRSELSVIIIFRYMSNV